MTESGSRRREYIIPDNFIEEGRILQGRVKIRNLIEAALLAFAFAFPALIIISNTEGMSLQAKITIVIFSAAPGAAAGIVGFNGDSMFTVIKCASKWLKERTTMLVNPSPSILSGCEIDELLEAQGAAGRIMEKLETVRQNRVEKKSSINLTQSEDFVFESGYSKKPARSQRGKVSINGRTTAPTLDTESSNGLSGDLF